MASPYKSYKRIGISQRVESEIRYPETRDCLDQRWAGLLENLGYSPVPLPNGIRQVSHYLDTLALSGFILSGGNDLACLPESKTKAPDRDLFETEIIAYAEKHRLPVLGVCRGFQLLNIHYGGQLRPISGHAATEHRVTFEPIVFQTEIFQAQDETAQAQTAQTSRQGQTTPAPDPRQRMVNSYHHYGILNDGMLAPALTVMAKADDGSIEAACCQAYPVYGIMWHPERNDPPSGEDCRLIRAILN
ncbi:MAG: gamma-glutamyl-gamma-aminobutyrate hydrolase family protein [Cyanobacteria bacterium P01_H01_bin.74]